MYDERVKLIKVEKSVNAYGDVIEKQTEREVFAELKSIGMNEFYQANAQGFKPELKLALADYLEYQEEKTLKYQRFGRTEEEYTIIRTQIKDNGIELVCKRGVD